ncbi:hypothetical protein HanHA300_Chr09g0323151 [Helianthus annuus]|nr:hypothetical protein HanHA300_Chr09g0323151 [Helianthus annuus]KAJ0707877.1 hypothetical protein HanLR1_Chr09g0323401 [Helianthus annuus]KAJ0711855.1 hypothetical protein HanOQP8_Chr09g0328531 [Helianthus annuus]
MAAVEEYTDTLNLKVAELLKEVQLDYSSLTTKTVDDTVLSIKECINKIPEDTQVTADLAPKFVRDIGADKVEFRFKRPKSIQIGGSYSFQCVVKPDVNVDLYIQLPKRRGSNVTVISSIYGKVCVNSICRVLGATLDGLIVVKAQTSR